MSIMFPIVVYFDDTCPRIGRGLRKGTHRMISAGPDARVTFEHLTTDALGVEKWDRWDADVSYQGILLGEVALAALANPYCKTTRYKSPCHTEIDLRDDHYKEDPVEDAPPSEPATDGDGGPF